MTTIREASADDVQAIRRIYNEGIEDRVATLEADPKSAGEMMEWWAAHSARYAILVASDDAEVIAWASLNPFSHRCAHAGIADLSIYVARSHRGRGVGAHLLDTLIERAREAGFHKIVLHALNANEAGKRLYRSAGFREVGVFREHGILDGRHVDVIAMERLLCAR